MKKSFNGYYPLSKEEVKKLWECAIIVLDTNVILNLYRLPTVAREDFLDILKAFKDRLWLPHHVALEFQLRRFTVISAERKATSDVFDYASKLVVEIKKRVDDLQIDKRGLEIDTESLIKELDEANVQLVAAIKAVHDQQLGISSSDPIREKIDELFQDRVGVGPKSQNDIDILIADGEERFSDKIPPGFMDAEKEKNPNEATFIFDKMKYQRKFGDLVIWRQLIEHSKENGIKSVMLVTADRKDDWWWREQGRTIGPHPELIREIAREAEVDLFWMYTPDHFFVSAKEHLQFAVSDTTVEEIKNVSMKPTQGETNPFHTTYYNNLKENRPNRSLENYLANRDELQIIERSVGNWLSAEIGAVPNLRGDFPDYIFESSEGRIGYDIKFVRQFDKLVVPPFVVGSMLRGYLEKNEGRLSRFTLIMAISEMHLLNIIDNNQYQYLRTRLAKLLNKYPIDSIMVGALINGQFELLLEQSDRQEDE